MRLAQEWDAPEGCGAAGQGLASGRSSHDLAYTVEILNPISQQVEMLIATTISPSIGYAAYYAAVREYPGRAIVLKYKDGVISRSHPTGSH